MTRELRVGDWDLRSDKVSSAAGKRRHRADVTGSGARRCWSQESHLLWETDILEGVDCSPATRGGKWEQIDEF